MIRGYLHGFQASNGEYGPTHILRRCELDYSSSGSGRLGNTAVRVVNYMTLNGTGPVTVAERSRACTVFARSGAGTVGSNLTQGMDV
jgi:hypothetical protein